MKNWLSENKYGILISLFLFIICLFFKDSETNFKFIFYYLFLYTSIGLLPENRISRVIVGAIRLPGYLLILISPFIKSFFFIWIAIGFTFMTIYLIFSKQYLLTNYVINSSIIWYLSFILASIIIVEFYEKILNIVISIFNLKDEKNEKEFISEFSKSLMNKNRIRFIIYFIYFLFLIPFSIIRLSDNANNFDMNMLNAAFYSFSTFLAYEKITQNLGLMKIDIKKTITTLIKNSVFYKESQK